MLDLWAQPISISNCKQIGRKAQRLCISSTNAHIVLSYHLFVRALYEPWTDLWLAYMYEVFLVMKKKQEQLSTEAFRVCRAMRHLSGMKLRRMSKQQKLQKQSLAASLQMAEPMAEAMLDSRTSSASFSHQSFWRPLC